MVITGLTRNQVDRKVSWVRIPPPPPDKDADVDTMSASFVMCEKSRNTGVFGCVLSTRLGSTGKYKSGWRDAAE